MSALTQVGRAMKELGVQMIPAYSPQARGRSERNFGTWQGRLPQELRLRGIRNPGSGQYVSARALHRRVQPPLHSSGCSNGATAFMSCRQQESGDDLHPTLRAHRRSGQHRTAFTTSAMQLEPVRWRDVSRVTRAPLRPQSVKLCTASEGWHVAAPRPVLTESLGECSHAASGRHRATHFHHRPYNVRHAGSP